MVGLGTNVLAVTCAFSVFSKASSAPPGNVADYIAKYGKLLENGQNYVQKGVQKINQDTPEQSHENMWNMLKRGTNQIVEEESKNENQKMALQSLLKDLQVLTFDPNQQALVAEKRSFHSSPFKRSESVIAGIHNQLLKDFRMMNPVIDKSHSSPIFNKRGFGIPGSGNFKFNEFMNPGLYKKSESGEKTENTMSHSSLSGTITELLGNLNNQAKRHEEVKQNVEYFKDLVKEQALKNAVHQAQKSKWAASVNGLFKKDGKGELGNVFKRSNDYFPLFKKSALEQYFPLFKRAVSGLHDGSYANGLDHKLRDLFDIVPQLSELLNFNAYTITPML